MHNKGREEEEEAVTIRAACVDSWRLVCGLVEVSYARRKRRKEIRGIL